MAKNMVDYQHLVPCGPGRTADNDIDAGEAVKVGAAAGGADVATTYQDFLGVAVQDADSGEVVNIAAPGSVIKLIAGGTIADGDPLVPTTAGAWIVQTNDNVFWCARALEAAVSGQYFWAQVYPPTEGGNISLLTTGS